MLSPMMGQSWPLKSAELLSNAPIAKVFYAAGFEEFQPSALDAVTDMIGEYFQRLVRTYSQYLNAPMIPAKEVNAEKQTFVRRYNFEEALLHTLDDSSIELEGLEAYVKDDLERMGHKLDVMYDRMKNHYQESLVSYAQISRTFADRNSDLPLIPVAGTDGVGAFNDGSDQFISGDFAEEIDEDFFGLRELGLEKEFGLGSSRCPIPPPPKP